jgi:SNF2 family DNA or RNA helicase
MYELMRQIYPEETQAPNGLIATCKLRTYQKQSLAFMINRENGTNDPDWEDFTAQRRVGGSNRYGGNTHFLNKVRCGLLCDEVGMGKSLVCIALVLANPSNFKPMTDAQFKKATVELRLMKGLKQSTIYQPPMVSYLPVSIRTKLAKVWPWSWIETIRDITENEANAISNDVNRPESIRKETKAGMKRYRESRDLKKAKEIQIDANNARIKREYLAMQTNILQQQMYPVKTTIIATTCTLVGQWYDEIKKFAPTLVVKVCHGSFRSHPDFVDPKQLSFDIRRIDILLSVSTTKLPDAFKMISFHRIIADEIHRYAIPSMSSLRLVSKH